LKLELRLQHFLKLQLAGSADRGEIQATDSLYRETSATTTATWTFSTTSRTSKRITWF